MYSDVFFFKLCPFNLRAFCLALLCFARDFTTIMVRHAGGHSCLGTVVHSLTSKRNVPGIYNLV